MLVVMRFRGDDGLRARLEHAHALLAAQRGYLDGRVARNVDDPALWVLQTLWEGPGAYRRALSAYDVKAGASDVLAHAIHEPSAYEVLQPGQPTNDHRARTPRHLDGG